MIYLDHAATTPADPRVVEAMLECMREAWANPSSPYGLAGEARRRLRLARRTMADALNIPPEGIVFTSGGTEANSQALRLAEGGHAVVSAIEHASVIEAARRWAGSVTLVPPGPDGVVRPEDIGRAIRPDTKLVSVQFANNETGVLQPVRAIADVAREHRVPFHCDAVQGFGQVPLDMAALGIDLLSLSAHKFYGPRGAGCLAARGNVRPPCLIDGGGQENGLRGGTEDLPAIWGMAEATRLAMEDMGERAARLGELSRAFLDGVTSRVPGARPLCTGAERLPGLMALLLPGMNAERAIAGLDLLGVCVSGGAACASRAGAVSHVYRALGLSDADAACVIRVSLGRHTTRAEVAEAAEAVGKVCEGSRQ